MIEPGITILVAGAFLIGVLGFFVMMASLLLRAFRWMVRTLGTPPVPAQDPPAATRHCPHADCAYDNPPAAIFCARCGRRLPETYDRGGHG